MTELSRREFLQFAGVIVLGHALDFELPDAPHYGRAFAATPVYTAPNGPISEHLWPDSISALLSADDQWYQVEQGFVKRTDLQPISYDPAAQPASFVRPTAWVTPYTPSAAIRQWCAPGAPLVSRVGYGGVMAVVDYLPGDPGWYGVGYLEGERIGWSQASHWRAIETQAQAAHDLHIVVRKRTMMIYDDHVPVTQTRIANNHETLPAGDYLITQGQPGGPLAGYQGVPWQLNAGNQITLSGVYWHNNFGNVVAGPTIQTTPVMAHWLYSHLGPNTRLSIIP